MKINKNCISSKEIVKVSKPSFFRQKCFSKKSRKKKTDNLKVKFVIDIIDIQNNDSDKETNFHSSDKQDKKELIDDDYEGIIFHLLIMMLNNCLIFKEKNIN